MNNFKAFWIKDSSEITRGDTVRSRGGRKAYTFAYVADNGAVATQEKGEAVFLHHPGDLHGVMVREVRRSETPTEIRDRVKRGAARAALTRAVDKAIAEGAPVYTEQKPIDFEAEVFGTYHSIDSKYLKSYKTRKALAKALHDMGATRANGVNALAVCNSAGRWTAIIGANTVGGNMTAFEGFMKFA